MIGPSFRLVRYRTGRSGTRGTMWLIGSEWECATLERPWLLNKKNESCIPAGWHKLIRRTCTKKSVKNATGSNVTFGVEYVPNRDGILVHPLNTIKGTKGCIGVGQLIPGWDLNGLPGIARSGDTFVEFLELLDGHDEAHLTIVDAF